MSDEDRRAPRSFAFARKLQTRAPRSASVVAGDAHERIRPGHAARISGVAVVDLLVGRAETPSTTRPNRPATQRSRGAWRSRERGGQRSQSRAGLLGNRSSRRSRHVEPPNRTRSQRRPRRRHERCRELRRAFSTARDRSTRTMRATRPRAPATIGPAIRQPDRGDRRRGEAASSSRSLSAIDVVRA